MQLHPNTVSISDLMTRLRRLAPISASDARALKLGGWSVEAKKGYATRSERNAEGNRIEATITSAGAFWVDVHNDGPTYNVAKGQDDQAHPCGAACLANEIVWAMRDGRGVPENWERFMTVPTVDGVPV